MAYDLGVTAGQRYIRPVYSGTGGVATINRVNGDNYYYHTFYTVGTFTNTSAIPVPIELVDSGGAVVQTVTVPPGGSYTVADTSATSFTVHSFTSSGVFTPSSELVNVSSLVVAGGGGGGYGRTGNHIGGGGGAGGVRYYENFDISSGAKTVTVGGGGPTWTTGSNSSITGFPVSIVNPTGGGKGGGDGGADFPNAGGIGPSAGGGGGSGGAGSYAANPGGPGIPGEGNNGAAGGGGGGAGAVGGVTVGSPAVGGAGGIGRQISITGSSTYYGGGGGGAGSTQGPGGLGGGGRGGKDGGTTAADDLATSGVPNTGGGGGAGAPPNSKAGAAGGSGIVIIKYPTSAGSATGGVITTVVEQAPLTVRYPAPSSKDPEPNFKNTTLLLSTDANKTFVDDASNNLNVSIPTNTRPDDFNPYAENYSVNFNGTTNYLSAGSTSSFAFGSEDFTVEAWIYVTGTTGTFRTIYSTRPTSNTAGVYTGGSFGVNPTGGLYWQTGELVANNASDLLLTNQWNHVAAVKNASSVNIFLNGSVVPNTDAAGVTAVLVDYLVVAGGGGGGSTGGDGFAGQGGGGGGGLLTSQINANFGVTYPVIVGAGAAVGAANGSTSSFISVVATGGGRGGAFKQAGFAGGSGGGGGGRLVFPGGAGIAGQGNSGGAANTGDTAGTGSGGGGGGAGAAGTNGVTGTGGKGGNGRASTISGTSRYYAGGGGGMAVGTGGAGGLGGGGAGASASGSTDLGPGGNATANTGGGGGGGPGAGPGLGGSGIVILSHPDSQPQANVTGGVTIITTGSNIVYTFTASGTISFVSTSTPSIENELTLTTTAIGANLNGSEPFNGYISNLRVVKGQGLYTEEFVVGTQPLTTSTAGHSINSAITGTVALLTAASNKFVDKSPANLSMTGTAFVSNLQPFNYPTDLNGSGYFGVGDYLQLPSNSVNQFQTNNFTIECWVYLNSAVTAANRLIWYNYLSTFAANSIFFGGHGSYAGRITFWAFNVSSSAPILIDPTALTPGVWTHLAVVRDGNNFTLYRNGVSVSTATSSANIVSNTYTFGGFIGTSGTSSLNGYMSNFRIVNGSAVYISNFEPDTTPLIAFPNTVLLTLQANVPANNEAFRDASDSRAIITPVGTVTQGTANPYSGGWSGYFDGSGDYLTVPFSSSFVFTENFTIEGWINPATLPALNSQKYIIASWNAGSNLRSFYVILQNVAGVNLLVLGLSSDGTNANAASVSLNWTPAVSTWSHFAIVRTGSTITMYANGVSLGTGTLATVNYSAGSAISIGADAPGLTAAFYWNGYISNLRIVNGTALYTTNFTPPAGDLPRIANTVLLTLQSNRFVDNSENNFTITQVGNASIERFSPHRTPGYNSLINSGSMYFNGTSDYLEIPHNVNQLIGTGDFTIEAWVYLNSYTSANPILSKGDATSGTAGVGSFFFGTTGASGTLGFDISNDFVITGGVVPLNSWSHVAVTRSAGNMYLWINGVLTASNPIATSINYAAVVRVGRGRGGSTNYFAGYMSDVRLIVGTALYVGPSLNSESTDNVVLSTAQSSSIVDNSPYYNTITGSATISSSLPPYADPSTFSYSFDGISNSSQVLSVANTLNLNFGSNDFTIEGWVYPTVVDGENVIVSLYGYSFNRRSWYLGIVNGKVQFRIAVTGGTVTQTAVSNRTLSINTWYFISAVKQGTTRQLYIDGVLEATETAPATVFSNTVDPVYIGAVGPDLTGWFGGLIYNLRIINGTVNLPVDNNQTTFSVPQSPSKAVPNTVLLLNGTNGAVVDRTGRNDVITVGEVKLQRPSDGYYPDSTCVMSFDGNGDYLTVPYNPTIDLVPGSWTFECWIYPTIIKTTNGSRIFSTGGGAVGWSATTGIHTLVQLSSSGTLNMQLSTNSANPFSITSSIVVAINAWTHVAACVDTTTSKARVFVNGVMTEATYTTYLRPTSNPTAAVGTIPGENGATVNAFQGYIDNLRVTKGIARYTSNFIVSRAPFSTR